MKYEKQVVKKIAKERIEILLNLAHQVFHKEPSLAKRYIELSRNIGMKSSLNLPKKSKMFICKKCGNLLVPGTNCRVRIRSVYGTKVIITCLTCKTVKRYPIMREKKSKKLD